MDRAGGQGVRAWVILAQITPGEGAIPIALSFRIKPPLLSLPARAVLSRVKFFIAISPLTRLSTVASSTLHRVHSVPVHPPARTQATEAAAEALQKAREERDEAVRQRQEARASQGHLKARAEVLEGELETVKGELKALRSRLARSTEADVSAAEAALAEADEVRERRREREEKGEGGGDGTRSD